MDSVQHLIILPHATCPQTGFPLVWRTLCLKVDRVFRAGNGNFGKTGTTGAQRPGPCKANRFSMTCDGGGGSRTFNFLTFNNGKDGTDPAGRGRGRHSILERELRLWAAWHNADRPHESPGAGSQDEVDLGPRPACCGASGGLRGTPRRKRSGRSRHCRPGPGYPAVGVVDRSRRNEIRT